MLDSTLVELAELFREHGESRLADGLTGMLEGDRGDLPQPVLELFTHGMGGIFDPALRRPDGAVDGEAEQRRSELAERLHAEAKAAMP